MAASREGGSLNWFRGEVQAIRERADWQLYHLLGTAALATIALFGLAALARSAGPALLWPLAVGLLLIGAALLWTRRTRRIDVGVTLLASTMVLGISGVIMVQRGSLAPALGYGLTTVAVVFIAGRTRLACALGVWLTAWTAAVTWAVQTGRLVWYTANPLGEGNARLLAFVLALVLIGIASRIVQRRREALDLLLERALRLTEAERDEARSLAERRARTVAEIGHEIRTPMTGIVGAAQLLAGQALPPAARQLLSIQRQSAERLLLLVNAVLDQAKIESTPSVSSNGPYQPRSVAAEVAELFAPAAHRKGVELYWVADAALPVSLTGDAMRVRQVLSNLVSNAVKFTSEGSVKVQLLRPAADRLRFEVHDTGRGIAADRLTLVFDRFVSDAADDAGSRGTGLGLPISRELARTMGGDVTACSESGRGSCFALELPCIPAPDDPAAPAAPVSLAPGRVWVVGASAPLQAQLRTMLVDLGLDARYVDAPPDPTQWSEAGPLPQALMLDAWATNRRGGELFPALLEHSRRQVGRNIVLSSVAQDAALGALGDVWQVFRPLGIDNLRDALAWALEAPPLAAPTPAKGAGGGRLRVLLADDNPVNQIIGRSMLEAMGLEVVGVHDGEAALDACQRLHFDLILMDLQMPGMNGLDATRQLRERQPFGRYVPVVAVTGQLPADIEQVCREAGIDAVLAKPYTAEQLRRVIDQHVTAAPA